MDICEFFVTQDVDIQDKYHVLNTETGQKAELFGSDMSSRHPAHDAIEIIRTHTMKYNLSFVHEFYAALKLYLECGV